MRKTGLQILSEIRQTLEVIQGKMAEVELQLAELEGFMDFDEGEEPAPEAETPAPARVAEAPVVAAAVKVEAEPVEAAAPALDEAAPVEAAPVEAPFEITADDLDVFTGDEPSLDSGLQLDAEEAAAPVVSEVPAPEPAPVSAPAVSEVFASDPAPAPAAVPDHPAAVPGHPAASVHDAAAAAPKAAVIDVLSDKCAWRTDIPASPVKNIISGISLNDRILFINTLFKGDAQAFQATINLFNTYESLSQAEAFIAGNYPGWDLGSDHVYRFMMAVRRKLPK